MTTDTDIAIYRLAGCVTGDHVADRLRAHGFSVRTIRDPARIDRTSRQQALIVHVGSDPDEADRTTVQNLNRPLDLLVADTPEVLDWPVSEFIAGRMLVLPVADETLFQHVYGAIHQASVDERMVDLVGLNIVGQSPPIQQMLRSIVRISQYETSVLIEGDTGTGKELVARSVHYTSPREAGPFVSVNCGAFNDDLLLAELFGHSRGAFTGAANSRRGLVAEADRGTLFFDEIDSLSPRGQTALLRLLQEKEYRPVGSDTVEHANVRVVCATNRDLPGLVREGVFREDLYYRLHVLAIHIPPLRDRPDDIPRLASHFLAQLAAEYDEAPKTIHPETIEWMTRHHWPGNVRELENLLHRAFVLTPGPVLCIPNRDTPQRDPRERRTVHASTEYRGAFSEAKARIIADFERDYLHRLMLAVGGNITQGAEKAGKDRRALARLLKKHRIDRSEYGADDAGGI